jgi:FemAB-related protein (PEP-CTERM system-associated)
MTVDVVELADGDGYTAWERFVAPRASTVMELPGWSRVVREAYGLRPLVLAAFRSGNIVGVLSMAEIRHPIFGHYLSTAPFGTDGGLIADDPEIEAALLKAAKDRSAAINAKYLLVRSRKNLDGFQVDTHYTTALVRLAKDADTAMLNLPSKTRNQVRKGIKEGFRLTHGPHEMKTFFRLFHRHMRDLGSPAHSLDFYQSIQKNLPAQTYFQVVWDGNEPVAGSLFFVVNGTAMNLQTISLKKYNSRCANYFMYWSMILFAIERGCTVLDMGRSLQGSRNLAFKENWAPNIVPVSYNYFLPAGGPIPFLDPRNVKFRMVVAAWKCLPVFLTKNIGPYLIQGIA